MRIMTVTIAILVGLLPGSAAWARQTAPTTQGVGVDVPSFDSLDKAHRGYLKRSDIPKDVESLKQLRAHFAEADRDGNGRLTPDEYATYMQPASNSQL
jgi:hypothetical protein